MPARQRVAPKGLLMSPPHLEIECFLAANSAEPNAALDIALEFARCMCTELRTILTQWEIEMRSLEDAKTAASRSEND